MRNPIIVGRHTAHAMLLGVALIWGLTFIFQSTGGDAIGPYAFVFIRFIIGSAVLAPFALRESRHIALIRSVQNPGDGNKVLLGIIAIGFVMAGATLFQQVGVGHTSVANAAFLTVLYVPFVPLIALLVFGKSISSRRWGAVVIFLTGTVMMSSGAGSTDSFYGDFTIAIGALFWAVHIMLVGWLMRRTLAPLQLSLVQAVATAVIALPFMLVSGEGHDLTIASLITALPALLFAGVVSTGIAFMLQMVGQQNSSNTASAIILSLESVLAAIAGWIFLGQSLTGLAIAGAVIILLAVLIIELGPADKSRL